MIEYTQLLQLGIDFFSYSLPGPVTINIHNLWHSLIINLPIASSGQGGRDNFSVGHVRSVI